MQKNHVSLSASDREQLQVLVKKQSVSRATLRRAQGLLSLDAGATLQSVALAQGVSYMTVAAWRDRYQEDGLALLQDKARSGRPPIIDGSQRAHITALACSNPPEGHARWSVRLLQGRAVELGLVDSISHDSVHQILKKTLSNRT